MEKSAAWSRIWVKRDRSSVRSWRVRRVCGCSGSQELETRACGAAAERETNTLLLGKNGCVSLRNKFFLSGKNTFSSSFNDFNELSVMQRWLSGWANEPKTADEGEAQGRTVFLPRFSTNRTGLSLTTPAGLPLPQSERADFSGTKRLQGVTHHWGGGGVGEGVGGGRSAEKLENLSEQVAQYRRP